ncbi:glycosyltransferase family 4 protein [Candidatus Woesearchaeota archaeon]|nr:glycosyltransferase family 4 protein [Candidatus Woesearchaeota archaeon]
MKKVIFFTNGITGFGGAERVLLEAAAYFQQKKVKLVIITFLLNEKVVEKYKDKIKFINFDTTNYFKRIIRLRDLIKKINPDLIIGQSSLDCLYLYLSTKFTRYNYISYVHGSLFWLENENLKYALIHKSVFNKIRNSVIGHKEFVQKKSPLPFFKNLFFNIVAFLEYLAVRKAKAIVVLTKQIQWEVKKLYNKNAIIIRGCIDKQLLYYKPKLDIRKRHSLKNKTIILNIGRLDHRKRIDVLIKSFFNLCPKYKNIVLMIGGKGPDKERLDQIINDEKYKAYKNRVIMLGFVPDNEYFDYLAGCDIFAFPSWTTSGIPTYEALALGKKVIWSSEAEEPVLTHPNVYVAEPNVEEFTKAIEKALNSKIYPKPNLKEHTWERYFEKLYNVASNVVNKC